MATLIPDDPVTGVHKTTFSFIVESWISYDFDMVLEVLFWPQYQKGQT